MMAWLTWWYVLHTNLLVAGVVDRGGYALYTNLLVAGVVDMVGMRCILTYWLLGWLTGGYVLYTNLSVVVVVDIVVCVVY